MESEYTQQECLQHYNILTTDYSKISNHNLLGFFDYVYHYVILLHITQSHAMHILVPADAPVQSVSMMIRVFI